MDISALETTIIAAKSATYIGNVQVTDPSRLRSHDLIWRQGDWSYRDSYFGGTDFLGQEVVWYQREPIWAMNYYGYIVRADLIDAERAGATIKSALSALYAEGRFLGGWRFEGEHGVYLDSSEGDACHFRGREVILCDNAEAYALDYVGGLIRD